MSDHTCHRPGCEKPVPPKVFMCRPDWSAVPAPLRREILRTYRPGQEITKDPSREYLAAAANAIEAVGPKPAKAGTPGTQKPDPSGAQNPCGRPPMAGAPIWLAVMEQASQGQDGPRCQCTGSCGAPHAKTDGRCPRIHGAYFGRSWVRLVAAPADLTLDGSPAATLLPAEALKAWCPSCHDGARRAALRVAREASNEVLADMDTLF